MEFSAGGLYFMIRYEDADELYIGADSMVFIGKNLEGPDQGRDAWYFQDSHSYCERGPLINSAGNQGSESTTLPTPSRAHKWKKADGPDIYILHEEDINQMITWKKFTTVLMECFDRRIAAGMKY
jgi:hypothetical protein